MTYGASLQALLVPDAAGRRDDIVLGHDTFDGYLARRQFFGATIGRYANRIAGARFMLDGAEVQLAANNGANALHGGLEGFDRRNWRIAADRGWRSSGRDACLHQRRWRGGISRHAGGGGDLASCRTDGAPARHDGADRSPDRGQSHQPQLFQSGRCPLGPEYSRSSPHRGGGSFPRHRCRRDPAAAAALRGGRYAVRLPRQASRSARGSATTIRSCASAAATITISVSARQAASLALPRGSLSRRPAACSNCSPTSPGCRSIPETFSTAPPPERAAASIGSPMPSASSRTRGPIRPIGPTSRPRGFPRARSIATPRCTASRMPTAAQSRHNPR